MQEKNQRNLRVVSLFSGCGGLDLGFLGDFSSLNYAYPRLPYEIVWANDINAAATATYLHNIGPHIRCGDVWQYLDTIPKKVDVVIGGFPCQDISVNGKRQGISGKRSGLYRALVEAVSISSPRVFLAENVKGLLMSYNRQALQTVLSDFADLGYDVTFNLYKAADYGVAQTRERVMIVGTRNGSPGFLHPSPILTSEQWITARSAIQDLESLEEAPEWSHIWSRAQRSPEQGNRQLQADRPGYTVRAECHGNIHFHYSLDRRMSMREAARIQSFPDNYVFSGGLRETERQIGNAVPPVLAWHLANAISATFRRTQLTPLRLSERAQATAANHARTRQLSLAIA